MKRVFTESWMDAPNMRGRSPGDYASIAEARDELMVWQGKLRAAEAALDEIVLERANAFVAGNIEGWFGMRDITHGDRLSAASRRVLSARAGYDAICNALSRMCIEAHLRALAAGAGEG